MQLHQIYKDLSLSALIAGFITVLVSFTSSVVIVIQAAQHLGASAAQVSSWILALGLSIGFSSIALSLHYKIPIAIAWSTPGAALLITSSPDISLNQAIGAFIFSGVLMAIAGFSGLFERLIKYIPVSLASAMLAGVLLQFGLALFKSLTLNIPLILTVILVYLFSKRLCPRYAILWVLVVGICVSWSQNQLQIPVNAITLTQPVWVSPQWSIPALIGIGLPLFTVTMASQNLPGIAIMSAAGYKPPTSAVIGWTGLITSTLAPLGVFAINFAAISAAVCLSEEAHPDKKRRYIAAVAAGVFYILIGLVGTTITGLFFAFPTALISAIAGLALLNTISAGLFQALNHEKQREPALITFLVTASGVAILGLGSAFWGLMAGIIANIILNKKLRSKATMYSTQQER